MSSFLVLTVFGLGGRMGGMLRRSLLRRPVALLIPVVALPLRAGSRRSRFEPVHDHARGDGTEENRACEQARTDQAQAAEKAPHHVITNYQRRSRLDRSI